VSEYIQDSDNIEAKTIWELFHNNPKLLSVSAKIIKSGELKGKIKLDITYDE